MINVYTDPKLVDKNQIILNCEAYFNVYITAAEFDELDERALKEIDRAILIDRNIGTVETPFGVTSIENLSTGCKTVLCYLYLQRHKDKYDFTMNLDITECGYNAINVLFNLADELKDDKTIFVLQHDAQLYECQEREYLINGVEKSNSLLLL